MCSHGHDDLQSLSDTSRTKILPTSSVARKTVRKMAVEYRKLVAVVKGDKYDRMAAELMGNLSRRWGENTDAVVSGILSQIRGGTPFSQTELAFIVAGARPYFSDAFTRQVAGPMFTIVAGAYVDGVKDAAGLRRDPALNFVDQNAIRALEEFNLYPVKHFYDDHLQGKIVEFGTQIIRDGLPLDEAGKLFEEEFKDKYESFSWRYWQGYANNLVTRSREMGALGGYERAGITHVEIRAVMDRRTTEICRHLHGRIIPVAPLYDQRDALLEATDPDQVKQIAPFFKSGQTQGKATADMSIGMPPYHFNCRTLTMGVTGDIPGSQPIEPKSAITDQQVTDRSRYLVNNLPKISKSEASYLNEGFRNASWGSHKIGSKPTSTSHFDDHGSRLGYNSEKDYLKGAQSLITNPKSSLFIIRDDRDPYPFKAVYHLNSNVVIIDIHQNRIKTFMEKSKYNNWIKRQVKFDFGENVRKSFYKWLLN